MTDDKKNHGFSIVDKRASTMSDGEMEPSAGGDKPAYVEQLELALAERDRKLAELLKVGNRSADEIEEAKKRITREIAKEAERNRKQLVVDFLEIIDNLDRALEAADQSRDLDTLVKGVAMVRDMFESKMEGLGVMRLDAMGHSFDPTVHEAMTLVPVKDPVQDGMVVDVLKEGYAMGGEVLRPASVVVGKAGVSGEK